MVFVLDKHKKPLMPCSEKRARLLLERKKAVIHKMMPFTIRLKERIGGEIQPVKVKIDPGSKATGIAVVLEAEEGKQSVLFLAELQHRGSAIRDALTQRALSRGRRRSANLRYRAPRFLNRTKPNGWLAPSLQHRVDSTMSWMKRLQRYAPVAAFSQELVKFDTQALENPGIEGESYQQGTLAGYELREFVLERDGRKCLYCGKENVPLNLDHVEPKSRGGSDRPSNLVLACIPCNEKKSNRDVREFLKSKPAVLARIRAQIKKPLRDAAAVNATRWALYRSLASFDLPVEVASGGRTKWNRHQLNVPKSHALDAACVGNVEQILSWSQPTLSIRSMGRGSYQRTRLNSFGFPRGYLMRTKAVYGFQTGDLVRADVPAGKHQGKHSGRVAVRASGLFNLQSKGIVRQGISYKHYRLLQRNDGYKYERINGIPPTALAVGGMPENYEPEEQEQKQKVLVN
jgi:5-methylcytosine-specific restriction endonuclease McrA